MESVSKNKETKRNHQQPKTLATNETASVQHQILTRNLMKSANSKQSTGKDVTYKKQQKTETTAKKQQKRGTRQPIRSKKEGNHKEQTE